MLGNPYRRGSFQAFCTRDEASRIAVNIACIPVGARKQRSCRISNATMSMNKGCLGVALGSDGGSTMHDIDRLRKEANRLRALAKQAKEHGKSEHADRLHGIGTVREWGCSPPLGIERGISNWGHAQVAQIRVLLFLTLLLRRRLRS